MTNKKSPILHPLALIGLAIWFSGMAMLLSTLGNLGLIVALSLISALTLGRIKCKAMLSSLLRMLPLLLLILIIQILFSKGNDGDHQLWRFKIAKHGLNQGLMLSLRLVIILFSAKILARIDYNGFDLAFRKLRLPEELTFMIFYAVHIIPAVSAKVKHLRQLLILRGIDMRKLRLRQRIDIYALTALSVLGGFISKSGIQAIALELRGFRSKGKSSRLHTLSLGFPDAFALIFVLVISLALAIQ
ncbi:MAG: energy-coupling factor transporter transmembrane component T [Candidatus Cloacimonadaceae bacterium]|nr:energy-coupling factor transporter transmembrane component T [Candidatus Cloacimonadaceae bacterium]